MKARRGKAVAGCGVRKATWRLGLIAGVAAVAVANGAVGAVPSGAASKTKSITATILIPGTPGATVGGYIAAVTSPVAKKLHLHLKLTNAGPTTFDTIPQVASGETTFTITGTTLLFPARAQNIPVVQVFAPINSPICVMYHPTAGITSWSDLNGKTVEATPGAVWWTYVKNKYSLTKVNVVNYSGSLAEFISTKNVAQQCFITNEPYQATQQGIPNKTMLVSSTGFNLYDNTLVTTQSEIKNNSAVVSAVVKAVQAGWTSFWKNPTPVYAKLPSYGAKESQGQMVYQYKKLKPIRVTPVGFQKPTRMKLAANQEASVGAITTANAAAWKSSFTNKYLPAP